MPAMALAYVILAHRNPEQLGRLLRVLAVRENTVALHIDAWADRRMHEAAQVFAAENFRIKLLRPRVIAWGQFSLVAAQLAGIRRLFRVDVPQWTHLNLISAQDFPLRSQHQLEDELASAPSVSFVSHSLPQELWPDAERRIRRYYLNTPRSSRLLYLPGVGRRLRKLLRAPGGVFHLPGVHRPKPRTFSWYGGSNHMTLARAACHYLVNSPEAKRIIRWFRYAFIPDESAFQSALLNSSVTFDLVSDDRREIIFERGSPHPKIITMEDWERLANSTKFFARKFDLNVDRDVIDRLEAHIQEPEFAQAR